MEQFKQTYISECHELLADMEERLLALDGAGDLEEVNAIFRCAHSIKGGAGAFGFTDISHFTHILETLLDAMREDKVPVTSEGVDLLLKSADVLNQMVRAAEEGGPAVDPALYEPLSEQLAALAQDPSLARKTEDKTETAGEGNNGAMRYHIRFAPHRNLLTFGNEPLLLLSELSALGDLAVTVKTDAVPELDKIEPEDCYLSWDLQLLSSQPESAIREVFEFVEDECDLTITVEKGESEDATEEDATAVSAEKPQAAPPVVEVEKKADKNEDKSAAPARAKTTVAPASIRVDVDKIDRLVNMVGELVITQALLQSQSAELPMDRYPKLLQGIDELTQRSRELQEAVMSVRMQPVKSVFARMPRIVRDIAQMRGKKIRLEMRGEQTEVDKTIIEQLSDPLTHMIRNAADHGIETPEERREKGKPEEGVITLSADNRGGRIVMTIEDDGKGLDRRKVLEKAISKGVVPADAVLEDDEIHNLIFAPGFSTAEVVSDISGRGVGMDVVRRNIQALGGNVYIDSVFGKGSRFTISLPLTLAILDGMIVRAGAEHYIIPIGNIIETLRPASDQVHRVVGKNDVINVRGEYVSLVYLHRVFGITGAEPDASRALVVLVEHGRERLGLVVDELVGQQQVVIKSLEENADPIEGISGATILGDGHVSLILDISGLHHMTQHAAAPPPVAEAA